MTEHTPQVDDLWGDGDTEWVVCACRERDGKYLIRCRGSVSRSVSVGKTKFVSAAQLNREHTRISTAASRAERATE